MAQLASGVRVARRVAASAFETINVMGPSIQFLTPLEEGEDTPCLMRGTIPPGVVVPLHSHADSKTFLQVFGEVEALVEAEDGFDWVRVRAGDVFLRSGWGQARVPQPGTGAGGHDPGQHLPDRPVLPRDQRTGGLCGRGSVRRDDPPFPANIRAVRVLERHPGEECACGHFSARVTAPCAQSLAPGPELDRCGQGTFRGGQRWWARTALRGACTIRLLRPSGSAASL
jgi:hypothetical protein